MNQAAAQAMQSLNKIYKCADERTGDGIDGEYHRQITAHYEIVGQFLNRHLHDPEIAPVPDSKDEDVPDAK